MPHDENDASDREAISLLHGLRSDDPAPVSVEARVMRRLAISLPVGAMSTGLLDGNAVLDGDARGESSIDAIAPSGRAVPREAVMSNHAAAPLLQKGAIAVAHPWAWALGFTVAGAVAGSALHATLAPEKVRVVYVDRAASAAAPREPTSNAAASNASTGSQVEDHAPASVDSYGVAPSAAHDDTRNDSPSSPLDSASNADPRSALARERALLDTARRAIAAGDHAACLAELRKHARAFPAGKLAEERDAMVVNALVGTGKYDEARQKAALFAKRYPHSFLAPSVEGAILAIPAQ